MPHSIEMIEKKFVQFNTMEHDSPSAVAKKKTGKGQLGRNPTRKHLKGGKSSILKKSSQFDSSIDYKDNNTLIEILHNFIDVNFWRKFNIF